jgi:hypothetical protein
MAEIRGVEVEEWKRQLWESAGEVYRVQLVT